MKNKAKLLSELMEIFEKIKEFDCECEQRWEPPNGQCPHCLALEAVRKWEAFKQNTN